MEGKFTIEQKNELLFLNLLMMFQTSAMQYMGKLKNPVTDKIERDMTQAQMSIDMLDMISEKTKNNLSENESQFINRIISELKLNFVDELKKDEKKKDESEEQPEQEKEDADAGEGEKVEDEQQETEPEDDDVREDKDKE